MLSQLLTWVNELPFHYFGNYWLHGGLDMCPCDLGIRWGVGNDTLAENEIHIAALTIVIGSRDVMNLL